MSKRIDFTLVDSKPKTENCVSGGALASDFAFISNSKKLGDVLQFVKQKKSVYWVTEGEWSMHQMLLGLLEITGNATVFISSYAMSETPARILAQLKEKGIITNLHCLLDSRIEVRTAGSLQLIKNISTTCKLISTHAKVTLIKNDDWQIAIIGSANYTTNKRFESGIISLCQNAFELNFNWINKCLQDEL
jgi:hypothetical protein